MRATYRIERAELTRAEIRAGLSAGWAIIRFDHNGSNVVDVVDTRTMARDEIKRRRTTDDKGSQP